VHRSQQVRRHTGNGGSAWLLSSRVCWLGATALRQRDCTGDRVLSTLKPTFEPAGSGPTVPPSATHFADSKQTLMATRTRPATAVREHRSARTSTV